MKERQSRRIPRTTVAYILICAIIIFTFFIAGLYPNAKSLAKREMEITKLQAQIEEQKMLYPFYQDLLKSLQDKGPKILPFPSKSKLSRDETDKVPSLFGGIAQKSDLEAVSISPDIKSIANGAGLLLINAVLKGGFFNFRKFLIELGKIAYLEHIEQIHIQQVLGGREFRLKIWLALEESD